MRSFLLTLCVLNFLLFVSLNAHVDLLNPPQNIQVNKLDADQFQVHWEGHEKASEYIVLSSNSLDSISNIKVQDLLSFNPDTNSELVLVCTSETSVVVNSTRSYCRIISHCNGQLSLPSPVISLFNDSHKEKTYARYLKNPYVDPAVWNSVSPYFLPENHPIKAKLDKIFSDSRVTHNVQTLADAGFLHPTPQPWSHVTVTGHIKLKGYLVKLYTDDILGVEDWIKWIERITGAQAIKEAIERHGFQSLFVVPKKWIYPLPAEPSSAGRLRKNFILVVEKLDILKDDKSRVAWKEAMTKGRLNAIYIMLQELGLYDVVYAQNLPFCKHSNTQAFIDTEKHHTWPIRFNSLKPYLSLMMQVYWDQLIQQGGPK
jgi:hypothetical protein